MTSSGPTGTATLGGFALAALLQALSVALKLTGETTMSWWWVLLPTWVALGVLAVVGGVLLAVVARDNSGRRGPRGW
jgi:hypothetical protein